MPKDTLNNAAPQTSAKVRMHPHFGPAMPDLNWVPAPRYLMRRDLLLRLLADMPRGRMLEIGCGAGSLLAELVDRGFEAVGVDASPLATALAEELALGRPGLRIADDHSAETPESFDYLTSFEVLEHIEDDHAALQDWVRLLRPGGTFVMSVPAHPERWNPADEWAGHFRRYRRSDLEALMQAAGLKLVEVQSYGFPLANVMEKASARVYARQTASAARADLEIEDRTAASGTDRKLLTKLWPIYGAVPASAVLRGVLAFQRLFTDGDKGTGYIAVGRKPAL